MTNKLPEEILCDAVEDAFTGPVWAGFGYAPDEIPDYFTLLTAAKMMLITARHFAPCTGPEQRCTEAIELINEMQLTKKDTEI